MDREPCAERRRILVRLCKHASWFRQNKVLGTDIGEYKMTAFGNMDTLCWDPFDIEDARTPDIVRNIISHRPYSEVKWFRIGRIEENFPSNHGKRKDTPGHQNH